MPRYQLEASIALVAFGASSFVTFLLSKGSSEPKIQLPVYDDEGLEHSDPFDVVKPEDLIDGRPLDADAFWKQVRLRKMAAAAVAAILTILFSISVGWSVILNDRNSVAIYSLNATLAVYVLLLASFAVPQNDATSHARYIVLLTGVCAVVALVLTAVTIMPNTAFARILFASSWSFDVLDGIWAACVALYIILAVTYFTTPLGPPLYYPPRQIYSEKTVEATTNTDPENVSGEVGSSCWDILMFSYNTKVVKLGNVARSMEIGDLPIVPASIRATYNFAAMRKAMRSIKPRWLWWSFKPGSGWGLLYRLYKVNQTAMNVVFFLAAISAVLFYTPAYFLQRTIRYLESDPERLDRRWGLFFSFGLFASWAITCLITAQLWSLSTTTVQVRLRIQMNTLLFSKTLVRKDVASSSSSSTDSGGKEGDEDDFSSKAQIMTLMTTDVDRTSEFAWHMFALIDAPIEIAVGTFFLYKLIGVSCFIGLAVTVLFLPINHYAGNVVVRAQDNLMKARDERVALMNEILGGIRMLKFMAWERSFEKRVLAVRVKELKYQRLNYTIETLWNGTWNALPVFVTLVSFWHFTVYRHQILTPSTAFAALSVFTEMKFALSALPETFINMLQTFVSLRRIEKYLEGTEVAPIAPLAQQPQTIAFRSATATWPQDRALRSLPGSTASTPRQRFVLVDLNLDFPAGELSLICGKLGSGKTLLLLALLGEVDLLAGQVLCPRSPPDSLATFAGATPSKEDWVVQGICAYVPQAAWLRNASIRENILFNLPYDEERYQQTLEACALISDLEILEDGDESEIGERGVNLSGGQKARVSLARAVYSRASILLLDDVLSAVDAHTARHLYNECLTGELMKGRTVILVSHHVQLCAPGAKFIVALDNGRVEFSGDYEAFQSSNAMGALIQTTATEATDDHREPEVEELVVQKDQDTKVADINEGASADGSSTAAQSLPTEAKVEKKKPRKLVEEEKRAVGRIHRAVWETYFWACGKKWYWFWFIFIMLLAALTPVFENGWLKVWSGDAGKPGIDKGPIYYITIYAIITSLGLVVTTLRWLVLYRGSIHASVVLYQRLLETVLFANIRFHDTVSRGRLLNRFGKDFEGIDSSLSDNFGRSVVNGLSVAVTIITITYVGGWPFLIAIMILGLLYWNASKIYGQTSRDMRRLDSVSRSPLYSIYGETISGVTIIRAFGASSKFLRDMISCVDTNANPYYWMWGVNRWLSIRFNILSSMAIGTVALISVMTPAISASLAGFALTFASSITNDLLFLVRRFVGLEQSMVALERVKEFSELKREPPEFIEPRPPRSWPSEGSIQCENLVIRYADDLPNVLHNVSFEVKPGEKIGILGRTGSGKSTLALSFFRFVEATEGRIVIDGIDIAKIGLTDLRSKLTIIPQDPTVLSGTLRSTLDVFDEYDDAEIFEALRRVHLIPAEDITANDSGESLADTINTNVFRNLDSVVSEGGENFSTGEKQLLCMARAILKRSKVLVMDEATASVDYSTDELISKTIRQEFASSTILTIAHRLRTVIDYDRVMLLDAGRIIEFDRPAKLLADPSTQFYKLCQATGKAEFATLKQMAEAKQKELEERGL